MDCDVRIRQDSVLPNHVSVHVDKSGRVSAALFNIREVVRCERTLFFNILSIGIRIFYGC